MTGIEFSFEEPLFLLIVFPALAVLLIPFLRLPAQRRKRFKKIAPVAIHAVVVFLLVLILSGFTIVKAESKQSVMIVADFSDSTMNVHEAIRSHAEEILDLIDGQHAAGVIAFAENTVYSVEFDGAVPEIRPSIGTDATDIAGALEYAASIMSADTARRIILLSDGNQTEGDAVQKARELATQAIRIDAAYFSVTTLDRPEVQICSINAPEGGYLGEKFPFTVEIKSNVKGKGILRLYDNEVLVETLDADTEIGSNVFVLSAVVEIAGAHDFRVELVPEQDTIGQNNIGHCYLPVAATSSVLIIADTKEGAGSLEKILSENCDVTTITASNAPTDMITLCNYDEVILLNVSYLDLPRGFDSLLEEYVKDHGRGVLTVGGENTYMYGYMEDSILEKMMPVSLSLSEEYARESVAIMLVLDCSRSMILQQAPTNLSLAKQGAIQCINAMSAHDYVGIISFNSKAYLNSELVQATDESKQELLRTVSALATSSGTYYTESLELAHQELLKTDASVKHVIFLSDGSPTDTGYNAVVSEMHEDGITVSTIGLADLFSSSILSKMAELGGGEFYYVGSAFDLPDIMLSETERVVINPMIEGVYAPIITEASKVTEEIEQSDLPMLYGYLGTTLKELAAADLTSEHGHPLYASWQYGSGRVSSFMSDLSGKWSSDWLSGETGAMLIKRMVKTTANAVHRDSSMRLEISIKGKGADLRVLTLGTRPEYIVTAVVSLSDGSKTYTLAQTAQGVYEGHIDLESAGLYPLTIIESDPEHEMVDQLETAIAFGYSSEYDAFAEGGEQLLKEICSFSGGHVTKDAHALAKVDMETVDASFDPIIVFAVASVLLMLVDIIIRKLRWRDVRNNLKRFRRKIRREE